MEHDPASTDGVIAAHPLFHAVSGGANPTSVLSAKSLNFYRCNKATAVSLVRQWHSRLPNTQDGPWQFAFAAEHNGLIYAVALWNNPCTRSLPGHWLELRRLACSPESPRYTSSRFLAWMIRYFITHHANRERCISYQDTTIHTGTIYKAAGWTPVYMGIERQRDRSKRRINTTRMYRSNLNGTGPDKAPKVRWERLLTKGAAS